MAKEQKNDKEEIEKIASEKVASYFRLSILLFGMGDKSPYDINELDKKNEFYQPAKKLSDELGIDWKKMSHEESNRIMLSLLDDYFNGINIDDDYHLKLSITVEKKK